MSLTTRPPRGRRAPRALVAVAVLVATLGLPTARPATADPGATYRPPVDAPVRDPFRPPTAPYGPGNRGLEYDTGPGTEVRAAAAGEVTFAGTVAGTRHVTIRHADGLRTTASRLATVAVVVGQRVGQGDLLGTTEGRLHFGARAGDAYLDPASLFVEGPPKVRLVPFDTPPGIGIGGERSAISQLLGLGSAVAGWAGDRGGEVARLALEYGPASIPYVRGALLGLAVAEVVGAAWHQATRECTGADEPVPPPAERRVALLVGGLGSSSTSASIDDLDTGALGYATGDVLRFSYRGGRTPGSAVVPGVRATDYAPDDTQQDLRRSGRRLADLVEQVAAANPGVPIDLLAHSQGGLVSRLAVEELRRRGAHQALGLLATIATPHEGSDLATMARLVERTSVVRGEVLDRALGAAGYDPDSSAVRQLSETSDLIAELGRTPLPDGLPALSIAARGDAVVPVPRTALEGATAVVVPPANPLTAHASAPGDPATTREVGLALAGRPPGCRGFGEALLDQAMGGAISVAEDTVAPHLAFGGPRLP